MSSDTLICPHCQYENIVLTCGFCLQCGEDVMAQSLTPQSLSLASTAGDAATQRIETALPKLISQASVKLNASCNETERGWRLTLNVEAGRKQTVHVVRGDGTESAELVAFLSLCGPLQADLAVQLLEWNSRLVHCAFAVRSINGEKMIVLNANLPVESLTLPLVIDALTTIARRGDIVEQRMSAGADRY